MGANPLQLVKKIISFNLDLNEYRELIGGLHMYGKLKTGNRWTTHAGNLDTFFSNNNELKHEFLSSVFSTFNDGIARYFVPEVHSGESDLHSIVTDMEEEHFHFINLPQIYKWSCGEVYAEQYQRNGYVKVIYMNGDAFTGFEEKRVKNGEGSYVTVIGERYKGEWKDNKMHGKGVYCWKNGDIYEGEWANGKRHGKGQMFYADGTFKEGIWENDDLVKPIEIAHISSTPAIKRKIKDVFCYRIYEGDLIDGKANGKGKQRWSNGIYSAACEYEGDWKDGKFHGIGKYASRNYYYDKDIEKYEGGFANGKRHGKGKHVIPGYGSGIYEGDFINGNYHGKGKITWPEGGGYEGDFINGKYHGKGKETLNGYSYEGDYINGNYHGKGKITKDGFSYEGDFINGKYHGKGKMICFNGKVVEGNWIYGLLNGNRIDPKDGFKDISELLMFITW